MMRIVENGEKVHMVLTEVSSLSVDTEEDRRNVESKMVGDKLMNEYMTK